MYKIPFTTVILWTCCDLCLTIRVPTDWTESESVEVKSESHHDDVETINPGNFKIHENKPTKTIPTEYFEYKAKKPQFAADIAAFHGVKTPDIYYKSYPIRPYTESEKPDLGKHRIYDKERKVFAPYQQYALHRDVSDHASPVTSSYEIYHPYKLEEPALQEIYKDPVLGKIRKEISQLKHDEPTTEISENEYLEPIDETDKKKFPHRNVPAPYEIYRPQHIPIYYKMPIKYNPRHQHLNNRFKHPLNQNYIKIKPVHYRPLQHHLHNLRQQHFTKYNDEQNEYPQVPVKGNYEELPDGYDIYQKGKANYDKLRNGVDENIAKSVRENRPITHQTYELYDGNNSNNEKNEENEEEFVPVKNYAQVRRTETTKHLPRFAAIRDASNYDEFKNAPRLREAVKSTKAQTVYSEEGYEDSAYDHAGEQKHASDHEDHSGYLKENEFSGGKYKTPSESAAYKDAGGALYGNEKLHGQKWENDDKDYEQHNSSEDYNEDENDKSVETKTFTSRPKERIIEPYTERYKREQDPYLDNFDNSSSYEDDDESHKSNKNVSRGNQINLTNETDMHGVNKREIKFEIPRLNLSDTFFTDKNYFNLAKQKIIGERDTIRDKYPYYFDKLKTLHKNSPLRYSENLKLIPRKTNGGSEFYNSRHLQCPEVDDNIDPIPERIKKNETNSNDQNSEETNERRKRDADTESDHNNEEARLEGLGDKIDCFKAKFFGDNPLDSPFFKEDIIAQPDPIKIPKLSSFKIKRFPSNIPVDYNKTKSSIVLSQNFNASNENNILHLLKNLNTDLINITTDSNQLPLKIANGSKPINLIEEETFTINPLLQKYNNSKIATLNDGPRDKIIIPSIGIDNSSSPESKFRVRRGIPFNYEPYKIIQDNQAHDSKRTTTTSNVSPLIQQLQSSKIIDNVSTEDQSIKNRKKTNIPENIPDTEAEFIDVNVDPRRGEPRYEMKNSNRKSHYVAVENKVSKPKEIIKFSNTHKKNTNGPEDYTQNYQLKPSVTLNSSYFDVSEFIPQQFEILKTAGSRKISRVLRTTTPASTKETSSRKNIEVTSNEEKEDNEEDNFDKINTTKKPIFRRKTRITQSTTSTTEAYDEKLEVKKEDQKEKPKLQLVTRLRQPHITRNKVTTDRETMLTPKPVGETPKYREKSKKTTKSTLVTDTQRYGEDDMDMKKDEVDAMIGIKEDMDKYIPSYEKEAEKQDDPLKVPLNDENLDKNMSSEEYSDVESGSDEDYDDVDEEDDGDEYNEEDDDNENDNSTEETEKEIESSTQIPTSSTVFTTEEPIVNAVGRNVNKDRKPLVVRKKIEIHKETPVNKSAPHVSQFKQDIKEIEIIKEMPNENIKKNLDALELYHDEDLAQKVNKLGDVEIFEKKLDLEKGPKHGGNYRVADPTSNENNKSLGSSTLRSRNVLNLKYDAEASETENKKSIDRNQNKAKQGNILLMISPRFDKNEKIIELAEVESDEKASTNPLGGNFKKYHEIKNRNGKGRNEKLIEFEDEHEGDDSSEVNDDNNSYNIHVSNRKLHGGNYRSSRLTEADKPAEYSEETEEKALKAKSERSRSNRKSSADLLNSFVQAAPILTTTPSYILDPSKRMYFYVD